ncbi:DUF4179 domain-containing protein [Paenibacillus profundus]|uniref:DUF4179 domain-containing protein n=1 Tax=Paenibacillus profundus TaxID=1173085 RepID=UPI002D80EDD7|nr:DUF4179 domain-containing protein [Paenibacillus profundus]
MTSNGERERVEQGYSQPVNLEVTDQGITLRVREVMVDPFRVSLMYGIEKDGKPINPDLLFTDFMSMKPDTDPYINNYVVTDLDGNDLKGVNLPLARTHGDNAILEVGIDDPTQGYFIRSPKDIPDTIVVHFDINLLGETKRKWQLKVPVSLAPAKSATNFIPLNKRYESPFGFKLDFLQLRHGPSKSELLGDIRESQAWRNQYGTLGPQFLYRIKDEQGQVVAAWDGINDMTYSLESKNALLKQSSGGGTTGRMLYRHAFLPFGDAKGLKLELDAVYTQNPVKTPFVVTFSPEELLGHPLEKNYDGKQLTFRVRKKTDEAAEPVPYGNTKAELKGRGFILELDQRLDQRKRAGFWKQKAVPLS